MKLKIVKAVEKDWEIVKKLEDDAIKISNGMFLAYTSEKAVKDFIKNSFVYLILEEKKVVGSFAYTRETKDLVHIHELIVASEFRGKGYGTQAIKYLLDKVADVKKVALVTHPYNTGAIKLYLKLGFRIETWKENMFGDGQPRIGLARYLR